MNRKLFFPLRLQIVSSKMKKNIDEQIFNQTNFFQSIHLIQNRRQSQLYGYFCKNYKYQQLGFTAPNYESFLNRVLTTYFNRREVTASTKTKSDVRGGGKKPWRQKGLGRARAGSSRSPLWRGGGVCFGPRPKSNLPKINKKEYALAIRILLNLAYKQNKLLIVKTLSSNVLNNIQKTYEIKNLLQSVNQISNIKNSGKAIQFFLSDDEYAYFGKNFTKAAANLSRISVQNEKQLSLSTFIKPTTFVFTINAFLSIRSKFV